MATTFHVRTQPMHPPRVSTPRAHGRLMLLGQALIFVALVAAVILTPNEVLAFLAATGVFFVLAMWVVEFLTGGRR